MNRYGTIGEASETLGVSTPTVRRWERAGTVIPEHTAGGRPCLECGMDRDHDVNAAITLKSRTPRYQPVERRASGSGRKTGTKPSSAKQESSIKHPVGRFGSVWMNGVPIGDDQGSKV